MRFSDLVTGLAFAALGIAIAVIAQGLPSSGGAVGPGLFPSIIGGAMAVGGFVIAGKAMLAGEASSFVISAAWTRDPRHVAAVAIVPLSIAAFVLLAPVAGSIVVSVVILVASALIWRERILTAAVVGCLVSLGIYCFFYFGLRVSLPGGVIEGFLQ